MNICTKNSSLATLACLATGCSDGRKEIVGIGNDKPAIRLTYRCPYENTTVPDTRTIHQDTPCYMACNGKIVIGKICDDEWYILLVWEGDTIYLVCNHSRTDGEPYFISEKHPYTYRRIQITDQSFKDIDFKFRISVPLY